MPEARTGASLRFPPHRSVFVRLVAVMVGTAVSLLAIVSVFFALLIGPNLGPSVGRVVRSYGKLLADTSPDLATAKEIAARLDVHLRYDGPRGSWTTAEDLPTIAAARAARAAGRPVPGPAVDALLVDAPDGGAYVVAWGHGRRMRAAHVWLLWITLGLVVGVVVVAHVVIRRSLKPLRTLHDGVVRLGEGDLDVSLASPSRDEFGALADAFNGMVRRVREMVAARDQLLVDVSHELRSPLTRMKVALALLPDGDKQRRMAADLAEMEAMIADLLERERLRDGGAIRPVLQDLLPILRDAVAAFQDGPPGVELVTREASLPVAVDGERIRTVLRNLLDNAVKYALPDSRPVEVRAAREGGNVVVRVVDDGPGIPQADLARVFEPFFRVDRSRSKRTGGYGLGLSICRRILEAHGGDVTVVPNEGRGVTFVVTFAAP